MKGENVKHPHINCHTCNDRLTDYIRWYCVYGLRKELIKNYTLTEESKANEIRPIWCPKIKSLTRKEQTMSNEIKCPECGSQLTLNVHSLSSEIVMPDDAIGVGIPATCMSGHQTGTTLPDGQQCKARNIVCHFKLDRTEYDLVQVEKKSFPAEASP